MGDGTGTYRSDRCQNVEVIDGRCRFCRNKKRNLRSKQWKELMKPPPETVEEADTADLLSIKELEQEVIERIYILSKQRKLECIPNDQKLLDAALLLHDKDQFITNIGNGKVFLVCQCCGEHRVVNRRSSNSTFCNACKTKKCVESWQYDPSIAVINTGRYTCISRDFFNWVRKALQLTRDEFTENTLDKDPKGGFEKAKQLVMGDRTLKQLFTARV